MQDIYIGIIIGVLLMSFFAMIGTILLEYNYDFGSILIGPAMWLTMVCLFIFNIIVGAVKPKKMTLFYFEELKKQKTYYRHLFGNYHMLRFCGNKKTSPLLYHFIIIRKIVVVTPEKMR